MFKSLIKLQTILCICGFIILGCKSRTDVANPNAIAKTAEDYVRVTIGGDVAREGVTQIKREFTERSIVDAGGGFGQHSDFGIKPKTFTLKRVVDGKEITWRISFKELSSRKWREFQFNEGDNIYVDTIYF